MSVQSLICVHLFGRPCESVFVTRKLKTYISVKHTIPARDGLTKTGVGSSQPTRIQPRCTQD